MATDRTPKKRTKAARRAKAKVAENIGPERGRVSRVAPAEIERFVLEEARNVRERKHPKLTKAEIVAIGRAKARGEAVSAPARGPKGKARTRERSANAYRKGQAGGPVQTRKKSVGRKTGGAMKLEGGKQRVGSLQGRQGGRGGKPGRAT